MPVVALRAAPPATGRRHGILPAMYTRHQPFPDDARGRFALCHSTFHALGATRPFTPRPRHAFD
jgi:hypothetical protein